MDRTTGVPPHAWVAMASVALLLAVAGRYGWHRDEMYFFEAGRHLAWGYVDFPPGVAAMGRLARLLFGDSLIGFRLFSALAIGAVVLITAAMARDLGGQRRAQFIAALGAGFSPVVLGAGHLVSTTTFELLAWATLTWLMVRLLAGGDERLWLVVGAVIGLGFLVKHSMLFAVVALVAALVIVGRASTLRSALLWAGAGIAAIVMLPNVLWHAANGWPVFDMLASLRDESETVDAVAFVPAQLGMTGLTAVIWLPGLWWLLRRREAERWRPLGIAYLVLAAFFVLTAGKPYYLIGMYPVLFAAGGVWWQGRHRRWIPVAAVVVGASGLVVALPLLPPDRVADLPVEDLEVEFGAQLGWERFVDDVAVAHRGLDGDAVIVTSNYGTAGAIDLYGPARGLPEAHSPHNHYWFWGPPPDTSEHAVVIGFAEDDVRQWSFDCTLVARFRTPHGVASEEEGSPIWACTGRRQPWPDLWPDLKSLRA